jgi:hypothetical protein
MKLNSPTGRVLYLISIFVAIGMNVLVWTQFDDTAPAFKVFFSLFTIAILIYNARQVFSRRDR